MGYNDTLLLIDPEAATAYEATHPPAAAVQKNDNEYIPPSSGQDQGAKKVSERKHGPAPGTVTPNVEISTSKSFHGAVNINASLAKSKLNMIAEEIIALLVKDPNATVDITLEIHADFEKGVTDDTKRSVSENTRSLDFKIREWE